MDVLLRWCALTAAGGLSLGRSLYYQDAKGGYERLGDMNQEEFKRLKELDVFRIHYFNYEADEYGFYVEPDFLQDAANAIIKAEPFDADLMLLLFRIATVPQQGAFLIW